MSAAVFNGNPAPPGPGDPQVRNSSGTNFLIGEGGFLPIVEVAYAFDEEPISSLQLSDVKLGAWYQTAEFPDLRRDSSGRSLADPASNGIPAVHGSNFGAYLVLDKMLWRRPDTATQGLAAFLRLGYAPPDRNLFSFEVDAGLTFKGLFPNRELDVLGVGAAYARIGYARRLDRDEILFTGTGGDDTRLRGCARAHLPGTYCAVVDFAAGSAAGLPSRRSYCAAAARTRDAADSQCFGDRPSIRYHILKLRQRTRRFRIV